MKVREPDLLLFFLIILLVGFGLVMVYSTSSVLSLVWYKDSVFFLKKQIIGVILGLVLLFWATSFPYYKYKKYIPIFLFLSILLLVLVLIPGIGKAVGGSRRWIRFGFFSFQPSEFAKMILVFYIADYFERVDKEIKDFLKGLLPILFVIGVMSFLVLIEPDMGSALSILIISAFMLIVGGANLLHIIMLGILSLPIISWFIFSEEYRRDRILAFLDPWKDPLGRGFHIIQALIALGSGGLLGVGLGASKQKFFYVPGAHTDFIFSIIGEELGFLGVISLIFVFFVIIMRGIKISLDVTDRFGSLLAFGITTKIAVDFFINVGVNVKIFPITGISLPLVSYGGTSVLFTLFSVGVLLNISRYRKLRR